MAVSLAFGVLFATFITLILVPISYLILDDVQRTLRRIFGSGTPTALPVRTACRNPTIRPSAPTNGPNLFGRAVIGARSRPS